MHNRSRLSARNVKRSATLQLLYTPDHKNAALLNWPLGQHWGLSHPLGQYWTPLDTTGHDASGKTRAATDEYQQLAEHEKTCDCSLLQKGGISRSSHPLQST